MWVKFSSTSTHQVTKLRSKLAVAGVQRIVIGSRHTTLADIRDDHGTAWAGNIAKEFHHSFTATSAPETLFPVPCTPNSRLYVLRESQIPLHAGHCRSCLALRKKQPRSGPVVTLFKLEGLESFDLDGLAKLLEERQLRAMEVGDEIGRIRENITGLKNTLAKLKEIEQERRSYQAALAEFLKKENLE